MEAPLIYVSIYALVTKTFTLRASGYKNKNNLVTKTQREIGLQKHTERLRESGLQKRTEIGYKDGYKNSSKHLVQI